MTLHDKKVFFAACFGMLLFGITMISLGTILPGVISKYGIDELSAGTLTSILPFGILLSSMLFGPVVDRYGYKYLLIGCSLIVILSLEGIAFSNEFHWLQIAIFMIGFGGGAINGATNALVNDISTEGKGANLSLLGVFYGIGALGIPALVGVFSKHYSESTMLSMTGFVIILPVIYFLLIEFPAPKQPQRIPVKDIILMFRNPLLIMLGMFLFFEGAVEALTSNWTTTYLQPITDTPEIAFYALSAFIASLTATRLLLGVVLRKYSPSSIQYISLILLILGSMIMIITSSTTTAFIGLTLLGMGCAAGFPVILGYTGELYKSLSGTAFSFVMVLALIGNMLINYLMGLVARYLGISNLPVLILACVVIMFFVLWIIVRKIHSNIHVQLKK